MINPLEQMDLNKSKFTKTDEIIYLIIKENIHDFLRSSITTLASEYGVSQASITRFCKKVGFSGFNDFRFHLYNSEKKEMVRTNQDNTSMLSMYSDLILRLEKILDYEQIEILADLIIKANTVTLVGVHKSHLAAKMLQQNLIKLGIPALTWETITLVPNYLNQDDLVLVFSAASLIKDSSLLELLFEETPAKIATITMTEKKAIKDRVDCHLWLPSAQNQNFPMYLENTVVFMVLADLLTATIAKKINN